MTLAEFLSRICPSTGYLYSAKLWTPPNATKPTFVHDAYDDAEALAKGLKRAFTRNPEEDFYFAMASFTARTKIRASDGADRPDRTKPNVRLLQCFWVDIDCKGAALKQYDNKAEGIAALSALVTAGNVPRPSILVDSGNGLHVYWCLTDPLTRDEWQPLADGLEKRLIALGLKLDVGISTDPSRVLRPIGADNNKDPLNPKPVHLLKDTGEVYAPQVFQPFRAFANDHVEVNPKAAAKSKRKESADALPALTTEEAAKLRELYGDFDDAAMAIPLVGIPQGQFEMGHIIDRCQQMQNVAKVKGAGSLEPMWKATLLLCAACKDGEEWAHSLSEGHADYTQAETQAKFDEQRAKLENGTAGATRCDHFERMNPGGCAGCPFQGQLNSPISLGRELATSNSLPHGFAANAIETYQLEQDEDGTTTQHRVCYGTFEEATLLEHTDRTETDAAKLELRMLYRQKRGVRSAVSVVRVEVNKLLSRNWNDELAGSGVSFKPHEAKGLRALMLSWAEELQRTDAATQTLTATSGWSPDLTSFTLGAVKVTAAGSTAIAQIVAQNDGPYEAKGTFAEWKRLVKRFLEDAHAEHQLAMAVSFGAPLAKLIDLGGCIFSLFSTETGTGKSTAQKIALSIWGRPISLMHNFSDTSNAVLNKIGQNPNTPAFWDELRATGEKQSLDEFTSVLFQVAQGREKARSDRSGKAREDKVWNTLMAVGTNFSLREQLDGKKSDTSPERARLLEFDMRVFSRETIGKNLNAFGAVNDNYGHAWPIYMQFVIANLPAIRTGLNTIASRFFNDMPGVTSEQARFWSMAVACVVVGAGIAKKLGLADLDPDLIYKCCVEAARAQVTVRDPDSDLIEVFKNWIRSNRKHWVVVDHRDPKAKRQCSASAADPLPVHIDMEKGDILIQTGILRQISAKICGAGRERILREALQKTGVWSEVHNRVVGKDTAQHAPTGRYFVMKIDDIGLMEAAENHLNGDLPRYDRII